MAENTGRKRRSRQTYTTKTGKAILVNRSLADRRKTKKAERAAEKALYLATLPKNKLKRLLVRFEPKRLYQYWFSRQGAIMGLKIVGVAILLGFFLTLGLFAYFRKDLPQLKDISGDNLGGSVSYYDSTGTVLLFQDYNGIKRVPVQSNQISLYMKEATVAIEDRNFYKEGAFDLRSIFRAALNDVSGKSLQGASTITEQLVKLNENWTGSRTIATKIKEVILAVEVDRQYTKDQILTGYLNIAPYGGVDDGVQAASEDYFRTSANNLTLAQAAMLAAIPQAPSYYSPYGSTQWNPAAGDTFSASAMLARQHYILQLMVNQKYITQAQADAAMNVNILAQVQPETSKYGAIQAPYFVLAAKQQLENQFGSSFVDRGGLKVITSLNMKLQQDAEQDVANNAANVRSVDGDQEAMVAESVKTGQVVALVGGEDFNNPQYGQINYANIRISPGSSMKPFVYAGLIQDNNDAGAGSVIYDSQSPVYLYPCTDKTKPTLTSNGGNCLWDDNFVYPGPETIRYALAGSRNVPAVKASYEVDPTDTVSDGFVKSVNGWLDLANAAVGQKNAYACYKPGVDPSTASVSDQVQCFGDAAIGGGDIAIDQEVNADVTLANLGQEIPQTYILKITDASGSTVYQWHQPTPTQVYKPDTAYIINSILDDPRATYLQPYQKFQNYNGWDIAVKTGTENQAFNGVMTAWNTQYAVIGFAGYHTLNKPLIEGHFEDITEPITRTWLEQAINSSGSKPVNWAQPAGVKSLPGYVQTVSTGFGAEVPGPTNDLYPSWYSGKGSSSTSTTIDKVSGLLATNCTPDLAKNTVGGASSNSFSIDIFYPTSVPNMAALEKSSSSGSTVSTQTDNVHSCSDSPPSVTVTATNTGSGSNASANGVCDGSCQITVAATAGTHPLSGGSYTTAPAGTITISLGGNTIDTINIPTDSTSQQNYNDTITYNPTSSGSGTLTATVVDSVLYSSSSTAALTYSTTSGSSITTFTVTPGGVNTDNFNWSGGTAPYTVTVGSTTYCTNVSSDTCTASDVPSGKQATITDSAGDTANATTP